MGNPVKRWVIWALAVGLAACSPAPPVLTRTPEPTTTAAARVGTEIPSTGETGEVLKLDNLDPAAPRDVITEMLYFEGGAGDPDLCSPFPAPGEVLQARQPETLARRFCWEGADAGVRLTVTLPDREQETLALRPYPVGGRLLLPVAYQFDLTRPAGRYTFQLAGPGHSEQFAVEVQPPTGPVMYALGIPPEGSAGGPESARRVHLAGFAPGEAVQLLVYRVTDELRFQGWRPVRIGPDGQSWVEIPPAAGAPGSVLLVALGPASGEVHLFGAEHWADFRAVCPGAAPTRLHGNQTARVVRDVPVFDRLGGTQVGLLAAGTEGILRHGPYCQDGGLWWFFVTPNDGLYGYVPEADGQNEFLEPVP